MFYSEHAQSTYRVACGRLLPPYIASNITFNISLCLRRRHLELCVRQCGGELRPPQALLALRAGGEERQGPFASPEQRGDYK